jgi:hypothetical protein
MLLNIGNLVVMDTDGCHLWRSFDTPTDTLLPWQPMTRNTKLVSASARGLLYSGFYAFYFASNNILTLIYNGPETSSIYWPDPFYLPWDNGRTTYNSPGPRHVCKVTEKEAYPSSQMFAGDNSSFKFGYFLSSALTLLVIEVTLIIVGCWIVNKWERRPETMDEGYMIISSQFRRFSYKELDRATNVSKKSSEVAHQEEFTRESLMMEGRSQ